MGWTRGANAGASLGSVTPVSGKYAAPSGRFNTTHSMSAGGLRSLAIDLPACSLAALVCTIDTAVEGGIVRLGIYQQGDDGRPGALIAEAEAVDAGSTGDKESAFEPTVQLVGGRYWLALLVDTADSAVGYNGADSGSVLPGLTSNAAAQITGGTLNSYTVTGVASGGLPDPYGVGGPGGGAPLVLVKFA